MTANIRKRFFFTVASNLLRSLLSFTTGMLLARWLGPTSYGSMAFLLGTFLGIRQLLEMGSSTAFFTFMSQRPRSKRFVWAFFRWLGVQFLIPLCVTGLLLPSQWVASIWHGHPRGLVLLAFVGAFLQDTVWPVMQQAAESQRQTLKVQALGAGVMAMHLSAVVLLWLSGWLSVYAVFIVMACEYLLAAFLAYRTCVAPFLSANDAGAHPSESALRQYFRYCLPLVPYSWVGFAYVFADRWLLQRFGGSVQQAFYSIGAQFSAIALIATSSILQIFWKEIAEAHHRGDHARTGILYRKVSRLLFFVGAVIGGFLIPWAASLLRLFLGDAYAQGAATLAIMFVYPMHQSMGQIGSTMLYATERVATQVKLGIAAMIVSIGATYFMLAPAEAPLPGLGLASVGLAVKMVVIQMVQVNILAYAIARGGKWAFDWTYQPVSLFGCLGLGWLAHAAAMSLTGGSWYVLATMGLAGMFYVAMILAFVYTLPHITGLTRAEIMNDAGSLLRRVVAK